MRVQGEDGGLRVQAIAGTHVVLFGFDVIAASRKDLLGFALEKTDLATGVAEWLPNFLRFVANDSEDGSTSSLDNPLQAFQWGDYGVLPGQQLRYRVQALYGSPGDLDSRAEVALELTTERSDDGRHAIYFNRGAAGSQAYARKFGTTSPLGIPEAQAWLSRGLEEGLLEFIGKASDDGWGLRGAFYEFSHRPVLQALYDAQGRGADVKLVVACAAETDDWPDATAVDNTEAIRAIGKREGKRQPSLAKLTVPRKGTSGIPHNKFLVLLEGDRPVAVWTGSTNITAGGLYGQSNVGHAVTDPDVAAAYLAYWGELAGDPSYQDLQPWVGGHSPVPTPAELGNAPGAGATSTVFSPRKGKEPLERYGELMAGAKQAVFLTAAFGISDRFEQVLAQNTDIPRYLLLEKPDKGIDLARADPDNHIATGAYIGRGGYRQFVEEHLTDLNHWVRYVHTKYLLIDPLTDHPIVISGSANFSDASTVENDENMLFVSKDERVADIYLGEFMRLFSHLRFRSAVSGSARDAAPDPREPERSAPRHLVESDEWTDSYFVADSPKSRERLLFSGQFGN